MPRLTKIYTRTGDDGLTGLVGNERVSKDDLRIWAIGTVDELNSVIGLARAMNRSGTAMTVSELDEILALVQNELFNLGAQLAIPSTEAMDGMPVIGTEQIGRLERLMDKLNEQLGPLEEFILPGGTAIAAALHQARTVCRRAERWCVRLGKANPVGESVIAYLNRLGDALFVMARWANHQSGVPDIFWRH